MIYKIKDNDILPSDVGDAISFATRSKKYCNKIDTIEIDISHNVEEDESFEEVKKSYTIIHNMEDIKRAFFNKEYELFEELVKQHEFIYYKVSYKYSSDNDNKPDYVARNLLKGFGRALDDYRKYLLVCFRCVEVEPKKYEYNSLWIVNTNDDLKTVIGSFYDDFDFQLQTFDVENSINKFLEELRKKDMEIETNIIGETYIH